MERRERRLIENNFLAKQRRITRLRGSIEARKKKLRIIGYNDGKNS